MARKRLEIRNLVIVSLRGRKENLHDDQPGEESPVTGAIPVTLEVVASIPRFPLELEKVLVIIGQVEALKLKAATSSRVAFVSALLRVVSCIEALQSGPVRVALEVDLGACILGFLVVVVARIFAASQLDPDTLHVLIDLVQSGDPGILGACAGVVESDDRETK